MVAIRNKNYSCSNVCWKSYQYLECTLLNGLQEREQFGPKIGKFQGVSFKLADMIKIDAADFLTLNSAWRLDNNLSANREVAQWSKLYASEMLAEVTDQTPNYGGMGFMDDHPWRDFGGTQDSTRIMTGPVKYKGTLFQVDLGH